MWNLISSIPAQIVCTQTDYMCCLNNFVLFSVRFIAVNSGKYFFQMDEYMKFGTVNIYMGKVPKMQPVDED